MTEEDAHQGRWGRGVGRGRVSSTWPHRHPGHRESAGLWCRRDGPSQDTPLHTPQAGFLTGFPGYQILKRGFSHKRGLPLPAPCKVGVSRWQIPPDMCDGGEHPPGPKSRATLSREAIWFPPRPVVTEPTVASKKSRRQQAGAPASHLNCSSPWLPVGLTLNHCTCGKPLASGSHLQQEWPE